MDSALGTSGFSVRKKLITLVLIPIAVLLGLAVYEINSLAHQTTELQRANAYSQTLLTLSNVYLTPADQAASNGTLESLRSLISTLYTTKREEQLNLLDSLLESKSLLNSPSFDERLEAQEWASESYNQMLLGLESLTFADVPSDVTQNLHALTQIEWLSFWANQETLLVQNLEQKLPNQPIEELEFVSNIQSLAERQQWLIERFIALNANPDQVSLMVEIFADEAFSRSYQFRTQILDPVSANALTTNELRSGTLALSSRLALLKTVNSAIEANLVETINTAVTDAEKRTALFTFLVVLLTLAIAILAVKLANRMTANLTTILAFLRTENRDGKLDRLTQTRDELGQFAREVERLTIERQEANERLLDAKNDAEHAKDAAIQASKAKSSFLANMSHEIRTPLNGVIGISEILADTDLTATQKDYVDTIETSSQLLLSLINDILDFSKIESGMLLISPHSTNIREALYDIAAVVAPKAKAKSLELKISIDPRTPYRLMLDDHRLRQVIMNFTSNAVKFTETGSVELAVALKNVQDETYTLTFSVADSGIGIDGEQQKKIFEPFAQEDDSTTRQFGGTGLGLAISTQLVELMGGKIQLDSIKGLGSKFSFSLELPVVQKIYQSVGNDRARSVYLICNNTELQTRLKEELQFFQIDVAGIAQDLQSIHLSDTLNTTFIYAETHANDALDQLAQFSELEQRYGPVCLIKHFSSDNVDYGSHVSAILNYPLLGQRMVKAIDTCLSKQQLRASQPSGKVTACELPTRILIVEDNKINQKIAALHVSKAGFTFDIANHGEEALGMIANHPYALILMDCMMPVMDGFEATQKIRHSEQTHNKARVPIIALTASVIDDDIQHCFDVGMDEYVPKPFKGDVLKEKIETLLGEQHQTPTPTSNDFASTQSQNAGTRPNWDKEAQSNAQAGHLSPTQASLNTNLPSNGDQTTSQTRILLVEDNRVNQKVAGLHLKNAGYQFDIAENGKIAVDMYAKDQTYSVILMDCMMPVKDGFEATKEIRHYEASNGLQKTPIIALTASVIDDDIQRCYNSGMDAYVPKPVSRDVLLHQIETVA